MTLLKRTAPIAALFGMLMFGLTDRPQAAGDVPLSDAVHRLVDFSDSPIDWLGPLSPWRPFLHRQFSEGLDNDQRQMSETYQFAGACEVVMSLELQGFLALYPKQAEDILDPGVLRVFETEIVPRFSHAHRRCTAQATLIAILEPVRRAWIRQPDWGMMDAGGVTLRRPQLSADDRTWTLYRGMRSLATLAMCESYRPALKDIVDYIGNGALVLLPHQMAVVKAAAHRAGIETDRLDFVLNESLSYWDPVERARLGGLIDATASEGRPMALAAAGERLDNFICGR